jgi:hypothetical protein
LCIYVPTYLHSTLSISSCTQFLKSTEVASSLLSVSKASSGVEASCAPPLGFLVYLPTTSTSRRCPHYPPSEHRILGPGRMSLVATSFPSPWAPLRIHMVKSRYAYCIGGEEAATGGKCRFYLTYYAHNFYLHHFSLFQY